MASYVTEKVIHYGAFKEYLDKIVDIMRSEYSGSVVIRGNPGSGKQTLIREAADITKVKCVGISPDRANDDYAAIKTIASRLGISARGAHIADLMRDIKGNIKNNEKLVVVLFRFEEFCRTKQSLLYNLMNLIHSDHTRSDKLDENAPGPNLTLIGLTCSTDWAENIEKRVRSRLNAKCIDITFPYRNTEELYEFSSKLFGGAEISEELRSHLSYFYHFMPNPSVRAIKKFLDPRAEIKRSKVHINLISDAWKDDHQNYPNILLRKRLCYLMRPQVDLLKLALYHCYIHSSTRFTLRDLQTTANRKNYRSYQADSPQTLTDAARLQKVKLIRPVKHDQPTSADCLFILGITSTQFKAIVSGAAELQSTQTDAFWKYLK